MSEYPRDAHRYAYISCSMVTGAGCLIMGRADGVGVPIMLVVVVMDAELVSIFWTSGVDRANTDTSGVVSKAWRFSSFRLRNMLSPLTAGAGLSNRLWSSYKLWSCNAIIAVATREYCFRFSLCMISRHEAKDDSPESYAPLLYPSGSCRMLWRI